MNPADEVITRPLGRAALRDFRVQKAVRIYYVLKIVSETVELQKKTSRKRRRTWVEPYLQRRLEQGHYRNLMDELAQKTPELFRNYTRTDKALFDEIVDRVTPHIQKQHTWCREPLEPGLRVAITLRFLATGDSYMSLQYSFRVTHNTISAIVPETCRAIVTVFGEEELHLPQTEEQL